MDAPHLAAEGVLQLGHEACQHGLEHSADSIAVALARGFHRLGHLAEWAGECAGDGFADVRTQGPTAFGLGLNLALGQVRHQLRQVLDQGLFELRGMGLGFLRGLHQA